MTELITALVGSLAADIPTGLATVAGIAAVLIGAGIGFKLVTKFVKG